MTPAKPKRHYDSAEMSRRGKLNKRSPWRTWKPGFLSPAGLRKKQDAPK